MRRESVPLACRLTIGSATQAMHAGRVLSAAGIRNEVVKTEDPDRRRGCSYAVAFDCLQERFVTEALRNAGIRIRT